MVRDRKIREAPGEVHKDDAQFLTAVISPPVQHPALPTNLELCPPTVDMVEFAPVRRVMTANLPLSSSFEADSGTQPAVAVHSEMLASPDLGALLQLGASCSNTSIFSHAKVPTSNDGLYVGS